MQMPLGIIFSYPRIWKRQDVISFILIYFYVLCVGGCVCLIGIKLVLKLFIFEKDIFKMVSCHA